MIKLKLLTVCIILLFPIYNMNLKAVLADMDVDVENIYEVLCVTCHGADGKGTKVGKKFKVPDFTDKAWQASVSDEEIIKAMTEGSDNEHYREGVIPLLEIAGVENPVGAVPAFIPKIRAFDKHQD